MVFSVKAVRRQAANIACATMFACWFVGQWMLDRTWATGLMFYIPSPVMLVALFSVAAWNHWANATRLRWTCVLGLVPVLFVVLVLENRFWPSVDSSAANALPAVRAIGTESTIRLVHWNVASGRLGWRRVRAQLNEQKADIYVLSEQPKRTQVRQWLAEDLGDAYHATWFDKMLVVCKGKVRDDQWLSETSDSHIVTFDWHYGESTIRVFLVDLISDLDKHRDPLLCQLDGFIREYQPDVIVGDFNAPRRSFRLQNLPPGYRHAYDIAGSGPGYTWPVPIPVYALDQCIVGPRVSVKQYDLQSSFSDHRLQRLDFQQENCVKLSTGESCRSSSVRTTLEGMPTKWRPRI